MADVQMFGGNAVKRLELGRAGRNSLGSGPYEYFIYETGENEEVRLDGLGSFTVYLLSKPSSARVRAEGIGEPLEAGGALQAEQAVVRLSVESGPVRLLVAGTRKPDAARKGLTWTRHADLYKVTKPWGHELWINGQHPCYALKEIFVKAGTKTSLQYHNFKQETNVLFSGVARLHYKSTGVANDLVTAADTAAIQLDPVSTVDVVPGTLHRLEALTDILLYETSTPHLDDVIRVSDDSRRPHGRMQEEHRS